MSDQTFEPGDFVRVTCRDKRQFHGWLADMTAQYVLIETAAGQLGFADAYEVEHA